MARDYAVQRMETLCASNRTKQDTIAKLQKEKADLEAKLVAAPAKTNTPGIIKISLVGADNKENEHAYEEEIEQLRMIDPY